jgi:transcriptional regulator with XRE-family HTH domain
MTYEKMAKRIQRVLLDYNLPMRKLANRAGMSVPTIWRASRGLTLAQRTAYRIERALDRIETKPPPGYDKD